MPKIIPPKEHNERRWHWIETQHGMMVASWYPLIGEHGCWDISGHCYYANAREILRDWRYVEPAIPPEGFL